MGLEAYQGTPSPHAMGGKGVPFHTMQREEKDLRIQILGNTNLCYGIC